MSAWSWVSMDVLLTVHERQIAEHGGGSGTRDLGGVASALARAQNLAAYGEPDAYELAAALLVGIAKNHGFVDGNKRTAWVVARLFLALHGLRPVFEVDDAVRLVDGVASGARTEAQATAWLREAARRTETPR